MIKQSHYTQGIPNQVHAVTKILRKLSQENSTNQEKINY